MIGVRYWEIQNEEERINRVDNPENIFDISNKHNNSSIPDVEDIRWLNAANLVISYLSQRLTVFRWSVG
mgnify:CR=1 FL=1